MSDRFWSKVDMRGPDDCWEWRAARHPLGYGHFWIDGVCHGAHRVAFFLYRGWSPQHSVLHTCDNPPCCNPNHLYIGTQSDNMRDRRDRGRDNVPVGPRNGMTKISTHAVEEIRLDRVQGMKLIDISRKHGVSVSQASKIARGEARVQA